MEGSLKIPVELESSRFGNAQAAIIEDLLKRVKQVEDEAKMS